MIKYLLSAFLLSTSIALAGAWHGKVDIESGLKASDTNDWDVSGGGGIPQWLTNYQFQAIYNSNDWITQSSDATNVLQFETEIYDLGTSTIPLRLLQR